MRTYTPPKPGEIERNWYVIDATDVVLGRLATHVATLLRGKHKATFAPHVDGGDFVIVINAEKVALTGNKRENKLAYRHSGYPGGLRATPPYTELLAKHPPERAIEKAVRGMLPQELARPSAARQAQGLRGCHAPAPGAAAEAVRDHPGRAAGLRPARVETTGHPRGRDDGRHRPRGRDAHQLHL